MPNIFAYRLPDTRDIRVYGSERLLSGIEDVGFTISPFDNNPKDILTIPPDVELKPENLNEIAPSGHILPDTTRKAHRIEIEGIKQIIAGEGKIVAARRISIPGRVDLAATFRSLCEAYPNAFVFLFHTSRSGTWIGATPELLAEISNSSLRTMALAGTRPAGSRTPWDHKNIEEQRMVTDFILRTLSRYYVQVTPSTPVTRQAGPVEHICTLIDASGLRDYDITLQPHSGILRRVLTALSPTPAVCGSDRITALGTIARYEPEGRSYYAGFCGPTGRYFVTLRSARIFSDGLTLYSGSGITPLSDADDEWQETQIKAQTLISQIKFIEKR